MKNRAARSSSGWIVALSMLVGLSAAAIAQEAGDRPYFQATHSHNDYYQPRPLLDALESGMGGIEPDVFYVEIPFTDDQGTSRVMRELYVAHDWEEIEGEDPHFRTIGTLTDTYLDPLWEIYHERGGTIYEQGTLLLHVDMKTDTEKTWRLLHNILQNYPGLVTTYDLETQTVNPGPVTVYTNAEPDAEVLSEYPVLYVTADGRFGDVFDPASWESDEYLDRRWRMPIVSSNLRAYNDLEQFFEFHASPDEIVSEYGAGYPDLTADTLFDQLPRSNWRLANELMRDGRITVADYLVEQMAEANRLGASHGHLMRFWASPDEEWFWDIVAPLEQVVLATDRPRDAAAYLQERAGD
jgi:hypothetical protein